MSSQGLCAIELMFESTYLGVDEVGLEAGFCGGNTMVGTSVVLLLYRV